EIGVRALQKGDLNQVIVGGVDIVGDLRALSATDSLRPYSRQSGSCPFDLQADGPAPGEGAVALVLKRLDDARRDGDEVYAVIRGIGSASCTDLVRSGSWTNGANPPETGGIASSSAYRQALERAYRESGLEPSSVSYLETDSSGWRDEDRSEAQELVAFFAS